jgi:hypothetical protein
VLRRSIKRKERKWLEKELKFPVVELDRSAQRVGFRAVEELAESVRG